MNQGNIAEVGQNGELGPIARAVADEDACWEYDMGGVLCAAFLFN